MDRLRKEGLAALRMANGRRIVARLVARLGPGRPRLLDVGCGHGSFLACADAAGMSVVGIEPDAAIARQAATSGWDVRVGYFPDTLEDAERFDVIAFNDVFEHLDDVVSALDACARALERNGVLSINIPCADGVGFRVAQLLARAGFRSPFERFWQAGYPSPHLWYFSPHSLAALARRHGFVEAHREPLRSIDRQGLWSRVHFTGERPSVRSLAMFAALWLVAPALNSARHADIRLFLFRREIGDLGDRAGVGAGRAGDAR